jgi:hypothetical protein
MWGGEYLSVVYYAGGICVIYNLKQIEWNGGGSGASGSRSYYFCFCVDKDVSDMFDNLYHGCDICYYALLFNVEYYVLGILLLHYYTTSSSSEYIHILCAFFFHLHRTQIQHRRLDFLRLVLLIRDIHYHGANY